MITALGAGINYGKLWSDVKSGVASLPGDVYSKVVSTVQDKAVAAVTPTVRAQAEAKAQRVISTGNIALMAGIGAAAGLLIAGGTWQRRTIGGGVGAILGGLAGLKVGLVGDSS